MTKWFLLVALLLPACGDGEDETPTPSRFLRPGTLMSGAAGGSERVFASDGSSIQFFVSGRMAMLLPKGVYLGSAFPAEVTFAVVRNGATLTGKAVFERVMADKRKNFVGETVVNNGAATLTGAFVTVTGSTFARITSFSYDITGGTARDTLYLQSDRLDQDKLAPLP